MLKLQHKAADGGVGGVAEVFFQLFGGELSVPIRGEDEAPQRFFLLCDLSLRQRGPKRLSRPVGGECSIQLVITFSMKYTKNGVTSSTPLMWAFSSTSV